MGSTATFRIDGQELKSAILKKGFNLTDVSAELGYDRSYITAACRRGAIAAPAAKMLETMYGIRREVYEHKEPEPVKEEPKVEETPKPAATITISPEKLGQIIYEAVYMAVSKAWNEPYDSSKTKNFAK